MSKVSIVMYHYVRDLINSRYPRIKALDYQLFKKQIEFFSYNYNVVTMEQVIEAWNSPRERSSLPENALLLTFDDGYIDNFTMVYPVLKEYHMQGSFFVPGKILAEAKLLDVNKIHFILASADIESLKKDIFICLNEYRAHGEDILSNDELFEQYAVAGRWDNKETIFVKRILQTALPEKIRDEISSWLFEKYVGIPETVLAHELYMNMDQIRCMQRDGMFFGLHGYEHYWLGNLSCNDMIKDTDKALDVIGNVIEHDNWVVNYPYGSYNAGVIDYIKRKGCKLGLTINVGIADNKVHDKYLLPRLNCNDFPPKSENYITIGSTK